MCLILSWNMGLEMMWRAIWLSQYFISLFIGFHKISVLGEIVLSKQVHKWVTLLPYIQLQELTEKLHYIFFLFFKDINTPSNENTISSQYHNSQRFDYFLYLHVPYFLIEHFWGI